MMNFYDASRLWWDGVTGPRRLVRDIVSSLQDAVSVVLLVPDDLPWRKTMRDTVEVYLRAGAPDLFIDQIDCETDCETDDDGRINVADYLMEYYATSDVRIGYRRASGLSIQKYMQAQKVLANRVVWVKGMREGQIADWSDFCSKYKPKERSDGLFVIEAYSDVAPRQLAGSFRILSYCDYVGPYDALLFNNMAVAHLIGSAEWLQYAAALASALCGLDVELSSDLIARCDFVNDDAQQVLREISDGYEYQARLNAPNLPSDHPFSLIKANDEAGLRGLVWKAQAQSILPLIEAERTGLIEQRHSDLVEALKTPFASSRGRGRIVNHEDQLIEDPYDAEIGSLAFIATRLRADDESRFLFPLADPRDRARLTLLRDMRNKLAHLKTCSKEEVDEFYSSYPHSWGTC